MQGVRAGLEEGGETCSKEVMETPSMSCLHGLSRRRGMYKGPSALELACRALYPLWQALPDARTERMELIIPLQVEEAIDALMAVLGDKLEAQKRRKGIGGRPAILLPSANILAMKIARGATVSSLAKEFRCSRPTINQRLRLNEVNVI